MFVCVCAFTHMPPEDPVQQAAPGRLRRLIPVQIRRSRPLRPEHIQISETLSFNHLNERGEKHSMDQFYSAFLSVLQPLESPPSVEGSHIKCTHLPHSAMGWKHCL